MTITKGKFSRTILATLALAAALTATGCVSFDSMLSVPEDRTAPFQFDDRGTLVDIPAGEHKVHFSIAKSGSNASEVSFPDLDRKFELYLPDAKVFLNVNKPLELSPESLHQPFAMQVTRTVDLKTDHYGVTFLSADRATVLATAQFTYKGDTVAYDDETRSFLQSFQKVRHSQRGTVIPIASRVSPVIDHLAQVYIAPWIYARYAHVAWLVSDVRSEESDRKWRRVVEKSPVVDVFLFNHEGDDEYNMRASEGAPWKAHQLRLVYTEGCDSASSSYFPTFLSKYGAAVAIGHRATSASPFVAFPLVRFWTYGSSALESTRLGWAFGSFENGLIDYLSFTALSHSLWSGHNEMLRATEPGLGWTPEMTPDKLYIDRSAVLKRETPEQRMWSRSFIETFGKDTETRSLDEPYYRYYSAPAPVTFDTPPPPAI